MLRDLRAQSPCTQVGRLKMSGISISHALAIVNGQHTSFRSMEATVRPLRPEGRDPLDPCEPRIAPLAPLVVIPLDPPCDPIHG